MKRWFKKFFVTFVTILTFGTITPFQPPVEAHPPVDRADKDGVYETKQVEEEKATTPTEISPTVYTLSQREKFLQETLQRGKEQAMIKFGSKIGPVIADEFQTVILPKIEKALAEVTEQFPEENLSYLAITEIPSGGRGEKIFHIYNEKTGKDIIRFHVRRDLRPQEGYWFNFHYHTYHDHFEKHYILGEIFWDKNTPPRWMS